MDIANKTLQLKQDFDDVYGAGKTKEWSDFWESYQKTAWGTRTDYTQAFSGVGWNDITFVPKYDIKPTVADRMFTQFGSQKGKTFNLVSLLNKSGVTLDFSKCTRFYYAFTNSFITHLGTIDMSNAVASSGNSNAFQTDSLTTIGKLIFSENTDLTGVFTGANGLKNINTIEGTIGKTVSFSACPLTKASITNVINALSDTKNGLSCTLKKTAKESAFTTDEWASLIATKPNWTFSLA